MEKRVLIGIVMILRILCFPSSSNLVKDVRDERLAVGIPSREKIVELSCVASPGS